MILLIITAVFFISSYSIIIWCLSSEIFYFISIILFLSFTAFVLGLSSFDLNFYSSFFNLNFSADYPLFICNRFWTRTYSFTFPLAVAFLFIIFKSKSKNKCSEIDESSLTGVTIGDAECELICIDIVLRH